jgi:hypothetical protein
MSKTVELKLIDRLALLVLLDGFKSVGSFTSNIEKLAHMLDDVKQVGISDEEKAEAKLVTDPVNPQLLRFDETYAKTKSVEFNDSTVDFVRAYIKDKEDQGQITAADKNLIELKKLFT